MSSSGCGEENMPLTPSDITDKSKMAIDNLLPSKVKKNTRKRDCRGNSFF